MEETNPIQPEEVNNVDVPMPDAEAVGETPVEQAPVEVEEKKSEPVDELVEQDRSEFNCPDCKGEGIDIEKNLICANCHGTGKVA